MIAKIKSFVKRVLFRPVVVQPINVPVLQSNLLNGRRALVTGGTGGIGYGIASAFLRSGAKVVITGRNESRIIETVKKLRFECDASDSDCVDGIVLDNCDVSSFEKQVTAVEQIFGSIDILVNNAGLVKGDRIGSATESDFDEVMATNLKGAYFLSQCVTNRWKVNGVKGNVLNICSASSLRPGNSSYILSKWGLRSLTIGMAKDLIGSGIVVNGLAPGATATQHFIGDGSRGLEYKRNPVGRMATVEEIANLAVVLVSDLGRMVVGDILYASGGAGVVTFDDV